ncbi:hypothetical protein DFQ26_002204 [Actinomortierella ambigua]|nr:hypothetical protein DFQ26_002204 [Actinomortierella ambigua]
MTDYWHQFHLWHREESPLVDTEYDLDREHQRAMHHHRQQLQEQQQHQQEQQQQQQQQPSRPTTARYHRHHHHHHHTLASPAAAAKRQHASSQGTPALARTSSAHSIAPSPSSPRRRTPLQPPRISVTAADSPGQSRELPRSTHDLNRLLESVFDDATAHAPMSHLRSHAHNDKDSASEDDDDGEDGPLCRVKNVPKTAPLSPKEKTLSHPPTLPLSSMPRPPLSVRPSHNSTAAWTPSVAPIPPPFARAPAPASVTVPKITSKPKFFVSDDSEEEDDGNDDDDLTEEDNEEDLLVANYRRLSQEIAQGHRRQQHRMPSPHIMDKGGHEGDDEREDDDTVADTTVALGSSRKQHRHNHHLNPNSHPLVSERRQSLLSDLLMAEKMANLAAKKSAEAPMSANECSMVNTSPIPARVATFKQVSSSNHSNHSNHHHLHSGARANPAHGSSQSSRCHSAANSDGESQLYPTMVMNGVTPECRRESAMMMHGGQVESWQHLQHQHAPPSSPPSLGEEDEPLTASTRSPLLRTRKSLFKKLDELVKATEVEEEERKAMETEMAKQRMALTKDALEEPKDYFGPSVTGLQHLGTRNVHEQDSKAEPNILTSAKPLDSPAPMPSSPDQSQQPKPPPQTRPEMGGWSRSSVQYQIQSLYGMSTSTVQRALSTATATLAEFGHLGSRGGSALTPRQEQQKPQAMHQPSPDASSSSLQPQPQSQPQGRLSAAVNLLQKHLSSH